MTRHSVGRCGCPKGGTRGSSMSPLSLTRATPHTSSPLFFFFNDTAPTEISPLSLPAALPICFVLAGARAELPARRYDRARGLLAGQPWLADYADGEGLAVLAEAEARLGLAAQAAVDYAAA